MKSEDRQHHPSTPEPKDTDLDTHPDGPETSHEEARANDEQAQEKQDEDLESGAESPA